MGELIGNSGLQYGFISCYYLRVGLKVRKNIAFLQKVIEFTGRG